MATLPNRVYKSTRFVNAISRRVDRGQPSVYTYLVTPPASKTSRRPAKRPGRPPTGADVAAHVISTRWTDADKVLLDALVTRQRSVLVANGVMSVAAERLTAADVLRSLVRQEAERQGIGQEEPSASPSKAPVPQTVPLQMPSRGGPSAAQAAGMGR